MIRWEVNKYEYKTTGPHTYEQYSVWGAIGMVHAMTYLNDKGRELKKPQCVAVNYFTPLRQCKECGKVSTPKKIQYRALCAVPVSIKDFHRSQDEGYAGTICMACYNKIRPIVKQFKDVYEIEKLINQLKRTKNDG